MANNHKMANDYKPDNNIPNDKIPAPVDMKERSEIGPYISMLVMALLLRLVIAAFVRGFPVDISTFQAWAAIVAERGFAKFFSGDIFADYPPGYIYVLYVIGKIKMALNLDFNSTSYLILIKLPSILADLITAHVLYGMGKKRFSAAHALIFAAFYAFNPAVIVNSSAWGQVDSFFTLFVVLTVSLLYGGRIAAGMAAFTLSLLIKPQAMIFSPLLIYAVWMKYSSKEAPLEKAPSKEEAPTEAATKEAATKWGVAKEVLIGVMVSLAIFVAAVIPFGYDKELLWIFKHYLKTMSSYPYASLNAFNLFALTGGNFVEEKASFFIFPYYVWGWVFIASAVAFASYLFYKKRERNHLFFIAIFLITAVFMLASRMHERYLFPALALSLATFLRFGDRRLLYFFIGISVTFFVNEAQALIYGIRQIYFIPHFDPILVVVSLINLGLFAYLVKIGLDLFVYDRVCKPGEVMPSGSIAPPLTAVSTARAGVLGQKLFTKKDYVIVSVLTAVNAAILIYNLGSFKAPQTYWEPATEGEAVSFDFGKSENVGRICLFGGIGTGSYRFAYSADKSTWTAVPAINHGGVFNWQCQKTDFWARYVRLTASDPKTAIHEVGFVASNGTKPIKIASVEGVFVNPEDRGKIENLIDEQGTIPAIPSYSNGTYFDEIYHARTAYEHLHKIFPFYENTHPPLGKYFIELGIAVFGMNPFGWRIAGVLFGIALIPLMYAFGKRFFGSTRYAFIATFLMSFDFMRFVQSRIATIDIYAVFFIVAMYYFMYEYYQRSFYEVKFRETMKPLALSGLFFGIGVSTKWICVYAGAGLAVIFFATLYFRFVEYLKAGRSETKPKNEPKPNIHEKWGKKKIQESDKKLKMEEMESIEKTGKAKKREKASKTPSGTAMFPELALKTLYGAVVFFVVVPAIVYCLSYLPLWLEEGGRPFMDYVVASQEHMYNYHKNLVATHPFSSNWYEWPVIAKPLWAFGGQGFLPDGEISSIVTMGNPAVWWLGLAAFFASIVFGVKSKDRGIFFIVAGAMAQYLPWVGVPRLTFIYHYFATVPFLIF
ncbi:MAG: glycosyltransferase family 39 protein, partial [Nitrospirae bacterium]|nr:glycosyltransferase family 39 protein [Nitrospirota bacterium]